MLLSFLLLCCNSQASFFNFPPFSVPPPQQSPCLLSTPVKSSASKKSRGSRGAKPSLRKCQTVSSEGWGRGVAEEKWERKSRLWEVPLPALPFCAGTLWWRSKDQQGRKGGADQVTYPKSACSTQRDANGGQRGTAWSIGKNNWSHYETMRWAKIGRNSAQNVCWLLIGQSRCKACKWVGVW